MAIKQVLWSIDDNMEIPRDSLANEMQLEEILENNIDLLNPDWMIIGRQISTHGNFIDLLAIDRAAIEILKKRWMIRD